MTAILDDTRPCLRIPIAELFEATRFLDQAAEAEVAEDSARATVLTGVRESGPL